MIRINRLPLPHQVTARMEALTNEIADAEDPVKKAQLAWERNTVRRDVHSQLRYTLRQMAPGNSCCMYCGNQLAENIDHFEPKTVNPLRTFCWCNHLLACSTCNSTHKGAQFPRDALGQPLLIDPTWEDPFDHLRLILPLGHYKGHTAKGRNTIEVCGLNKDGRPRARASAWRRAGDDLLRWRDARDRADSALTVLLVDMMRDQPFADVYHAAIRQADLPTAENLFFDTLPELLAVLRDPDLHLALLS